MEQQGEPGGGFITLNYNTHTHVVEEHILSELFGKVIVA